MWGIGEGGRRVGEADRGGAGNKVDEDRIWDMQNPNPILSPVGLAQVARNSSNKITLSSPIGAAGILQGK